MTYLSLSGLAFVTGMYTASVLTPGNPTAGALVGLASSLTILRGLHSE